FKQETAYEIFTLLEFRRVLFRSIEPGFHDRRDVGIHPLDVPDIPLDRFSGGDLPRPDFLRQGGGIHVQQFRHRLTSEFRFASATSVHRSTRPVEKTFSYRRTAGAEMVNRR